MNTDNLRNVHYFEQVKKGAMVSLVETLGEKLECAICLDQYKEPKVLSCLHSYCRGCLEKLVKRVAEKYTIKCPECRSETQVTKGAVSTTKLLSCFVVL